MGTAGRRGRADPGEGGAPRSRTNSSSSARHRRRWHRPGRFRADAFDRLGGRRLHMGESLLSNSARASSQGSATGPNRPRTYVACCPMTGFFSLSRPRSDSTGTGIGSRHFVGIDLGRAPVPDESTILGFRHLLEKHELGGAMLNAVNQYLERRGLRITTGTIVDATIIHAPSSTKNRSGERDPEMHQTRKGKQWYFGLKAHIGVDSKQGHVHSVCTSAASVADKHMLPDLLHGEERKVGRRVSGTGRSHPAGGSASTRYDQPESALQELCGRVTKSQEPGEG